MVITLQLTERILPHTGQADRQLGDDVGGTGEHVVYCSTQEQVVGRRPPTLEPSLQSGDVQYWRHSGLELDRFVLDFGLSDWERFWSQI